jgi:hypothetical protein
MAAMTVLALATTAAALAQEAPRDEAREEERSRPVRSIRVLQNPYDLASFYRSAQEGAFAPAPAGPMDPAYAIAGFYRSSQDGYPTASPYGWSAFWTGGYAARRPAPLVGYPRSIGENGDLFLVVPFLAPVGPLSGAFFGY